MTYAAVDGHAAGPFEKRPLLVFWEMTKACRLACFHCRADAQLIGGPDELTTDEGRRLIDSLASIGRPRPILILTGGDCLMRDDIVELAAYARSVNVPTAIAPSVTPQLTSAVLQSLRNVGVKSALLSLDGAIASTHDAVRGIDGHFDATLLAISQLREHGFTTQINTTVMPANVRELADIAKLLHDRHVDVWEVFFLITTGRGTEIAATSDEGKRGNMQLPRRRFAIRLHRAYRRSPFLPTSRVGTCGGPRNIPARRIGLNVLVLAESTPRTTRAEFGADSRTERRHPRRQGHHLRRGDR